MAPIIPTYRPIVTATRAAVAVAIAAVACSVFLAFSPAVHAASPSAPLHDGVAHACADQTPNAGWCVRAPRRCA